MKGSHGRDDGQRAEWLCVKWPSFDGTAGGCKLELPWLFKTVKNVGLLAVEHIETIKHQSLKGLPLATSIRIANARNLDSTASISKSERGRDFPFVQQFLPKVQSALSNLGQWGKKKDEAAEASVSKDELGELEERALAQALARRKPATIVEFYSPKCKLCRSLVPAVAQVESKYEDWLHIVMADVENKRWLPEVISSISLRILTLLFVRFKS
jgi:thiol-disulfide isomerase/thioredoxin